MKSICLILSISSSAMASPLRPNRFVATSTVVHGADSPEDIFSKCKTDQITSSAGDKALDASCKLIPGCETATKSLGTAKEVAEKAREWAKTEAGAQELSKAAEEVGYAIAEEFNAVRGATNWAANVFQLFSPSFMRQCLTCVLGMPKKQFGKFMTAKVDGWKPGTEVCTIPFTTKCDATGKKQALLNAWANTVAGELQTKAKTSGTVQTAKIKEKFAALPAAEISANVIFQQLKDEVLQAREFWSTHDWTGKDPACKLDDKAVTTFTGKAWKGGECN